MNRRHEKRGGAGRGQGRKPLSESGPTVAVTLKMTEPQRDKLGRLGGAKWVRKKIESAKEPAALDVAGAAATRTR